ncbi:hypothetical protein GCM10023197_20540 [Gordonia humi]
MDESADRLAKRVAAHAERRHEFRFRGDPTPYGPFARSSQPLELINHLRTQRCTLRRSWTHALNHPSVNELTRASVSNILCLTTLSDLVGFALSFDRQRVSGRRIGPIKGCKRQFKVG